MTSYLESRPITQLDMNIESNQEFEKMNLEMNQIINQIIDEYKYEKEFIQKLKLSQTAWEKFRDAQLEALYPAKNKRQKYGSVYPMCYSSTKAELTYKRIEQLNIWLEGIEEGDVCSGSVKMK